MYVFGVPLSRLSNFSRVIAVFVATIGLVMGISVSASATPALITDIPAVPYAQYTVISPDGSRLYVMSQNSKQLIVIDTSTNTAVGTYDLSAGITTDQVSYLTISPDGSKIYVSGYGGATADSKIFVINLSGNTPTVSGSIGLSNPHRSGSMLTIAGTAITPDGRYLYVTVPMDSVVQRIDTTTNQVDRLFTVTSATNSSYNLKYPVNVAVSPNGQYFFVTFSAAAGGQVGYAGFVSLRVSDDTIIDQSEFGLREASSSSVPTAAPWGVTVASDGHTLYVSSSKSGGAWIKDILINSNGTFGATNTTTVAGVQPGRIALSADGTFLYVATFSTSGVRVLNTSNMSTVALIPTTGVDLLSMIAPSPDTSAHTAYIGSTNSSIWFIGEYIGPNNQVLNQTTGASFSSAALTATGLPGTVTYSISPGLPTGLTFNSSTGVISGVLNAPLATSNFVITGTNGSSTATARVTLTVTGSGSGGSSNSSSTLANTGSSTTPVFIAAALLITCGAVIVFSSRRQRKSNNSK